MLRRDGISGGYGVDAAAVALFLTPVLHPLLIPVVGVPSHLLWWIHVFPVATTAYRYGRLGALAAVTLSALWVVVGERLFGAGYGVAADWETATALGTALTATNGLIVAFAISTRSAAQRLHRLAYRDGLTGLPNRRHLEETLQRSPAQARLSLLFLDLDDMKTINDSLGHAAGDAVLVAFAQRLRSCVRSNDTIARWSGDEFVVLSADAVDESTATAIAKRIQAALEAPVEVQGLEIAIHASIGIALGEAGADPQQLLREADTALYQAKLAPSDSYQLFDRAMHDQAKRRLTILNGLRRAVDNGELLNHYQPIFSTADGRVQGAETLVRWRHPEHGMISPGEFIPLAETSGLIVDVGAAVLDAALADLVEWERRGLLADDFYLSVNVSAVELQRKDFARRFVAACQRHQAPTHRVLLEITETAVMETGRHAVLPLHELREAGARLAIDDFGSGYSSLRYLNQLPVDVLKIDRELVQQLNSAETSILRPIADFAAALGLKVIAEGVEEESEARQLHTFGVDALQGFLLARPAPADALRNVLQASPAEDPTAAHPDIVARRDRP